MAEGNGVPRWVEERLDTLEEKIASMERVHDRALEIQTKELARRLDDLNHEADRLRNMQSTYLPREVWERAEEALKKEKSSITASFVSIIIGIMFTLINIILVSMLK